MATKSSRRATTSRRLSSTRKPSRSMATMLSTSPTVSRGCWEQNRVWELLFSFIGHQNDAIATWFVCRDFKLHFTVSGANVYYTLEKYEEAIADCERAMQIDPNFTKVGFRALNQNMKSQLCGTFILFFLNLNKLYHRPTGILQTRSRTVRTSSFSWGPGESNRIVWESISDGLR